MEQPKTATQALEETRPIRSIEAKETHNSEYAMQWGRTEQRYYFVCFRHLVKGHTSWLTLPYAHSTEAVRRQELLFCTDHDIPYGRLWHALKWNSDPVAEPVDAQLRGCPFGCGRVLRSHERFCPNCVHSMSLYENAGGW